MRILLGRLRILFIWDQSYDRLAYKVHTVVDRYISDAIARQKDHTPDEQGSSDSPKRYIILDELVRTLPDRAEVRDQVINIFLPTRDATALGLSNACFLLARHPRVWHKLRTEVLSIKGPVTYDVLQSLKYMRCVLNESQLCSSSFLQLLMYVGLRLHSPVTRNIRLCLKDCVLPLGGGPDSTAPVFIPRGSRVTVNFGAMHRDKDIWGPDADDFRPERWEEEGFKPGYWQYIPFSGGPRICPGKRIALIESAYVLVRIMRVFESIDNRDPEVKFIERNRLTIESRNGVQIALLPSQKS